jgi:hypothetical protein
LADANTKRFFVGIVLAWAPWVPAIIGLILALRAMSGTRATGLAAVAGGVGEILVFWGTAAMIISQIAAIVWLGKSFSPHHRLRNLVSVCSIVLSGLTLVLMCFFLWSVWFSARH